MEKVREGSRKLEKGWRRLEQVGEGWRKFEKVREGLEKVRES